MFGRGEGRRGRCLGGERVEEGGVWEGRGVGKRGRCLGGGRRGRCLGGGRRGRCLGGEGVGEGVERW